MSKKRFILASHPAVGFVFTHGFSAHFDAMGVVNQTVQDAIGDGGSPICSCQRETGS